MAQQKLAKIQNKEKDIIFPITTSEGVLYESLENLPKAETVQDALDELASGIATKADIQDLEEGATSDLDITDEDDNVLLRLSNGHIRTKNFNSANTAHPVSVIDSSIYTDLDISDSYGNNLVRFSNGHIKTSNFDSSKIFKTDNFGLDALDLTNPLANINQSVSMASIFKTWGFIGDSLSSGETQCTNSKYVDNFKYSWGQRMCKLLGAEGYNYSFGGMTAKMWMNNSSAPSGVVSSDDLTKRTKAQFNLDDPKDAYIIALGVNDTNSNNSSQYSNGLGSFSNVSSTLESVCRYYADIIKAIKSKLPRAHIFVVTAPNTRNRNFNSLNNAIRSIPNNAINWEINDALNTIHVIDLAAYMNFVDIDLDFIEFIYGTNSSSHMTAAGYEYMAHVFMTYIDWIIRTNPTKFKDVALIGTDYTYVN